MDSVYDPAIWEPNARMLAESKRTIEVKNNVFYWPKKLTDFWTTGIQLIPTVITYYSKFYEYENSGYVQR